MFRKKDNLETRTLRVLSEHSERVSDDIFKKLKREGFVDETSVERLYEFVVEDLRNAGVMETDYEPEPSELQGIMRRYVLSEKLDRMKDAISHYDKKFSKHFGSFVSLALLGAASYLLRDYLGDVPSAVGVLSTYAPAFYHLKRSLDALLNKKACDISEEIRWFGDNIKPPASKLDCPPVRDPDYLKITDSKNYE